MAWLGSDLIVCTALRAMLLDVTTATYTQIFALAPESPSTMLVQGIPDAQQALLLVVGGPRRELCIGICAHCSSYAHDTGMWSCIP